MIHILNKFIFGKDLKQSICNYKFSEERVFKYCKYHIYLKTYIKIYLYMFVSVCLVFSRKKWLDCFNQEFDSINLRNQDHNYNILTKLPSHLGKNNFS